MNYNNDFLILSPSAFLLDCTVLFSSRIVFDIIEIVVYVIYLHIRIIRERNICRFIFVLLHKYIVDYFELV